MKTQARVVVIGGGANGVSTLFHLARAGWTDLVLCERTELTAGSTWHAAGLLPLYHYSYTAGQFHKYSVDFYKTLGEETGQEVSFHITGNLRLAHTREWMDEYRKYCGIANTIGVPFEMVTPQEIKELWPFAEVDDLIGGIYHPQDGHIAPADVTYAMAKGARALGAEIYQHTPVRDIVGAGNQQWRVITEKGEITCEHIVLATGNYAREMGALLGLDIPAIPMQHQYIVTEEHPVLVERHAQGLPELPVLRDARGQYYMREERKGLILGPYEKDSPAVFVDGVDKGFEKDLFPGDLDRLMPHVEAAMKRVPIFAEVGIKDVINGPMQYTPDGTALVGPAWGLRNVWLNEGHTYGIVGAAGVGNALSAWIIDGEPPLDMWDYDPRRYGDWADKDYTKAKNEETYSRMYHPHYPNEEFPAARPKRTSALHERLDKHTPVWGQRYGLEVPLWYAVAGEKREDTPSFRRSNDWDAVRREVLGLHENAGLMDISGFSNFEVSGSGAEAWLDSLLANKVPTQNGSLRLCHALHRDGGIRSEFTVTRLGADKFYVVAPTMAERYDWDFLTKAAEGITGVEVKNRYKEMGTLVIAGAKSRDLLQPLTNASLATADFPWLSGQEITVAGQAAVRALRVNFVGDLGWELHASREALPAIYDALLEQSAQQNAGLTHVGMRALNSLRLDKSYRLWAVDLTPDYSIYEAGMGRFVRLNKTGGFHGRDALVAGNEAGWKKSFVTLEIHNDPESTGTGAGGMRGVGAGLRDDADRPVADPYVNEPLFLAGSGTGASGDISAMVGRVTSGGRAHRLDKTLALAYLDTEHAAEGTELEIEILGVRYAAIIISESPFDPENARLKA